MPKKERNSSIELLKLFGILLIVLSHVVQTLGANGNAYVPFEGYGIDLTAATADLRYLIIAMLQYSGTLGNTIFFVCSAWFLLDSKNANKKKIYQMIADIWIVSFIILIVVFIIRGGNLNGSLILRNLLPNTFGNNWFLGCYMIFYAIHPVLNKIIYGLGQKSMLRTTFIMIVLYLLVSFFTIITGYLFGASNNFWGSTLVIWVVIYFIIGYQKLYLNKLSNNVRFNIILVILGMVGNYGLIAFTNFFGLKTSLLDHALQIWNVAYNPFFIALVIGLFNLSKSNHFVSKPINYISGLSMFIYIIHENHLLRTLYRPAMWNQIYSHYGYNHIIGWIGLFTIIIFIFGVLSSIIYFESIHKLIIKFCNRTYPKISSLWKSLESRLMKIH